jgi:hypothetical protein
MPASAKARISAAGGRGFFRRLHQHRAAGGQRGADLAHHLVDREVPRRERGDRAHRVLQHHLLHGQVARGHDAAVDAAAFVGEPLDDVGGGHGLALGFGQRLALLLRQQLGDRLGALAHQAGGLAHDLAARVGGHVAPGLEALLRGFQGLVEVGLAGVRHLADLLAGGRVDDVQRLAAGGVDPFVVDQQAGVGVGGGHGELFPSRTGDEKGKSGCTARHPGVRWRQRQQQRP